MPLFFGWILWGSSSQRCPASRRAPSPGPSAVKTPKVKGPNKEHAKWAATLSCVWKRPVSVDGCPCRLEIAYNTVMEDRTGYVTDEELIEASGNTLRHK